ncbi:MAG: hypothetical protein ISEC1_P0350 [Thiomicrorhabdus sp.]|nr:MAG: hypothetical protein ISEC1_P0350 [Thiomicrorhabdus sp.]
MSDGVLAALEQQPDLSKIQKIKDGKHASVYKVLLTSDDGRKKQIVRVIRDIKNYHSIRREKDLLNYLNQFSEFSRFNEIRKVGFYYLQFFDYEGSRNLKQQIKKKGPLLPKSTKRLLSEMVSTLEKVHSIGFVHTAIRPSNIIVGKKQNFLVDWSNSIPSLSSFDTEEIDGNARYCPPERLNGQLDEKGDIYALGCTLYYALTGKHIYLLDKVETTEQQLWAQVHHSIRKINRLPIFWRYLIIWMTQKDPLKRPTLEELTIWLADSTVPEWIRNDSFKTDKTFPKDSMGLLADEHYLYPIFQQAVAAEADGDLETAFNLYENCAFRGYSRAENNIGLMYEQGNPVKQSYSMAANMYDQAYNKGNPDAAYNLAKMFEKGLGIPVNLGQAYRLYKFAALKGHLDAQNALALMYQAGSGIRSNQAQAMFWFSFSAHFGNRHARQNIQALSKAP